VNDRLLTLAFTPLLRTAALDEKSDAAKKSRKRTISMLPMTVIAGINGQEAL
tara:strand:- start:247 stop:402 length:156 start_codon:yes stop_codon:yes gene_type:complete